MIQFNKIDSNTVSILLNKNEIARFNWNKFEIANRPYIFPIMTPNGLIITRHYPIETIEGETHDHPHHTGVWTAWGAVNGVDNWAFGESKGKQILRDIKYETTSEGGIIKAEIDWMNMENKPNLAETRIIKIHDPDQYPVKNANAYVMSFVVKFQTKYGAVKFGDTKEGGLLSVRVASQLDVEHQPKGGRIENAQGGICEEKASERNVWGRQADWCDYSGILNDKQVGVAILSHPSNPISPTYWHVRSYGLMTANPFGKSFFVSKLKRGTFKMKANTESIWRYRLVVHNGLTKDAQLPTHYADFIKTND
jgi:hypothetical protein